MSLALHLANSNAVAAPIPDDAPVLYNKIHIIKIFIKRSFYLLFTLILHVLVILYSSFSRDEFA
jgi:hypothetical protein